MPDRCRTLVNSIFLVSPAASLRGGRGNPRPTPGSHRLRRFHPGLQECRPEGLNGVWGGDEGTRLPGMVIPPDLPRRGRLDVVCLRPIHHVLEYEALYRLTAAIRERSPGLEVVLHVRSALCDEAAFARLPVRS